MLKKKLNTKNNKFCSSSAQLSSDQLSSAQLSSSITLNFFQVYVYLLIIKYYSIYLLKTYSNSFLNLLNLNLKKAFIYLNVFINIYLMDIITQKVFYQNIFLN